MTSTGEELVSPKQLLCLTSSIPSSWPTRTGRLLELTGCSQGVMSPPPAFQKPNEERRSIQN